MHGRVESVEWLTPHLVRVVLGGDGLRGFTAGEFSDHYVKLMFPPPGATYTAPFEPDVVRETLPRELWPVQRTYSVRRWDSARGELTVDFVVHGDSGVAGPWAARARRGDLIQLRGPGGAYTPDPMADWHLMVGDEAALPAIAASLERVPPGRPVHVLMEVDGSDDEIPLWSPGDLRLTWLHRSKTVGDESLLPDAVADLTFPDGSVHAFVHGEAGAVRAVRRHLLAHRRIPRAALSVSGYWRRSLTEDGWQSSKAEWNAEVDQDLR